MKSLFLFLTLVLVLSDNALAQNPPPAGRGGARGGGGGGRGGGRGRGPIRIMTLTSTAFTDGGMIPNKYAQPGHDHSPALSWSGAPDSTQSFVLVVHDIDAAIGDGNDDTLHWLVWNIPGTATGLSESVAQGPQLPDGSRQISASGPYYRGPAAPPTGPPHHYLFELYALDAQINIAATDNNAPVARKRSEVVAAMATHIRGKAALVGLFRRAAPPTP